MAYTLDSIDWTKPVKIQGTFIGKTHDPVLFDLAQRSTIRTLGNEIFPVGSIEIVNDPETQLLRTALDATDAGRVFADDLQALVTSDDGYDVLTAYLPVEIAQTVLQQSALQDSVKSLFTRLQTAIAAWVTGGATEIQFDCYQRVLV